MGYCVRSNCTLICSGTRWDDRNLENNIRLVNVGAMILSIVCQKKKIMHKNSDFSGVYVLV